MSLYKAKAVYAASDRQYTAAGGEVHVPRVGIYEWSKAERQEIDARVGKARSFGWVLSLCGHKTGAFKHRKPLSFEIGLCSNPYLWPWIRGNDRKNINSSAMAKYGIFAKSPRYDKGAYRG